MRITSLVVAVVAGFTFAVTGCGGTIESEEAPESVQAETQGDEQGASQGEVTAMSGCPLRWYCDSNGLNYSSRSTCNTECSAYGDVCYADYACDGTCICP